MVQSTLTRAQLEDLVIRFTEAFNQDDLDGVMAFMADDATYDEFNGTSNHGKAAIRAAFVPQFRGDYGTLRFHTEDLFVDAEAGKALIRWLCTLERGGAPPWLARSRHSARREWPHHHETHLCQGGSALVDTAARSGVRAVWTVMDC
jgi:ketosteroid isomerase-like protein